MMGKDLMIYFDEDGVAREYDDTYDITIHCESEEEKRKAIEFIKARKWGKWIPVTNGRGGHECSLCHSYAPSFQTGDEWLTDYCPTCGADMRGRT